MVGAGGFFCPQGARAFQRRGHANHAAKKAGRSTYEKGASPAFATVSARKEDNGTSQRNMY